MHGGQELKDHSCSSKSESVRWLQALKLDQSNPQLFYCIGLHTYLFKGDQDKALKCFEKALVCDPSFTEAFYLLCVILTNKGQIPVERISEFQKNYNRTLPFTYFLKGINCYETESYVQAIENFQNTAKFQELKSSEQKPLMKPNYPNLDDSVMRSNKECSLNFKTKFGTFGLHSLTVTNWKYLTMCFYKINRHGAALKSLHKTFKELEGTISPAFDQAEIPKSDILKQISGLFTEDQKSVFLKINPIFGETFEAVSASKDREACLPFISLASQVLIHHSTTLSLICSQFYL